MPQFLVQILRAIRVCNNCTVKLYLVLWAIVACSWVHQTSHHSRHHRCRRRPTLYGYIGLFWDI